VNGWILGYLLGAVVVAVVVTVLLLMVLFARRTAEKAEAIVGALQDARDGTAPLWEVQTTVQTAERIVDAAATARDVLAGGGRS
jgi:hypothetical protein